MAGHPLPSTPIGDCSSSSPSCSRSPYRIVDEEKMLTEELDGYIGYTREVHYRLVPMCGSADRESSRAI